MLGNSRSLLPKGLAFGIPLVIFVMAAFLTAKTPDEQLAADNASSSRRLVKAGVNAQGAKQKPIDFNRDIRPILSDKCFACHGPDAKHREADLRLDLEEPAKEDLGGYSAVVPGKPAASEMIVRIEESDKEMRMPPDHTGKELKPEEIDLLKRWIREGAKYADHWAYVYPARETISVEVAPKWGNNWIDTYIWDRLQAEGLSPSEEADRTTLIRRLSFDLRGLPPTSEEVQDFLQDNSPNAYEKVVDKYLASEAYGERMAIWWLDLVRFADTVGYHGDQPHHAWPYRDYVIKAFNANMPFDQFTREQLAGDMLDKPTQEQLIATCYNRLLQTSHEGGVQLKEYRAIYLADRVRNVSQVWMGATVGCAQCHDHKYDPYSTEDFYRLGAFFADIDDEEHIVNQYGERLNLLPTYRYPQMPVVSEEEAKAFKALEDELVGLHKESKAVSAELADSQQAWEKRFVETPPDKMAKKEDLEYRKKVIDAIAVERSKRAREHSSLIRREFLKSQPKWIEVQEKIKAVKVKIDAINNGAPLVMYTKQLETPREVRVLPRGNWLDESGPLVEPAVPKFLGTIQVEGRRANRLDLANWLLKPKAEGGSGELTARVQANRFWQLMMGNGIARVMDDFGGQGEPPYHPELLDALAVEFISSDWDMKHLLKSIAMSATYRQSSKESEAIREIDPDNRLYSHQSRPRLPAELIRDNVLEISGLLVKQIGGASVHPYQPEGLYRHLNFPEREYKQDNDSRQYRRGVYVHWQRQFVHPMLKAFDAPNREECTAGRPQSNTPVAALVMLNDPTFVEASRAFAERLITEAKPTTRDRIDFAMHAAVSRPASESELLILEKLFVSSLDYYRAHPEEAKKLNRVGLKPVMEGVDEVELAAWSQVTRTIFNMNEVITRN